MSSVYANGNAIACKSGDGKVVAAFPDVCMSPPSPPAGPIPVPYPDSSFSRDMKEGSRSVTVGGKEVMLKGQSYFKSSPLGDEAATRSFGGSIVTHTITGKTYFAASSMDVKIEGKNVCRHLDITTSNHASDPGATPPIPEAEAMSPGGGGEADVPLCDCCGKPAHSAMQAAGKVSLTEQEFYSPSPLRGDPPAFAEEARTLMAEILGRAHEFFGGAGSSPTQTGALVTRSPPDKTNFSFDFLLIVRRLRWECLLLVDS